MLQEQIANFWVQLSSRMAAPWTTAPRGQLERAGSILDADPIDVVNGERSTEPYVPANNERVSEASLHISC
jgi:hypothetical protein